MMFVPRACQFRGLPSVCSSKSFERPWSDIPMDIAGLVLRRLPALVDRVRFAAVCQQWRAAAREIPPLSPPLPLLMRPDGTAYSFPCRTPLSFPASVGYAGSSGNWLLYSGNGACLLWDPLTEATVPLPVLSRFRTRYTSGDLAPTAIDIDNPPTVTVTSFILCSPHLIAAVVMLGNISRIAVCKPGADSWWSICMVDTFVLISDMVFHQGKLFVVCSTTNDLFAIDISLDQGTGDPLVSRIHRAVKMTLCPPRVSEIHRAVIYLIASRGALLMVRRAMHGKWGIVHEDGVPFRAFIPSGQNTFQVFKADFEQEQWTQVTTVGDDQVLFLSRRQCRSLCVSQLGMFGDRIVFFENDGDEFNCLYDKESLCSCSVYNMRDGEVSYPLPNVFWKRGTALATWQFPQHCGLCDNVSCLSCK